MCAGVPHHVCASGDQRRMLSTQLYHSLSCSSETSFLVILAPLDKLAVQQTFRTCLPLLSDGGWQAFEVCLTLNVGTRDMHLGSHACEARALTHWVVFPAIICFHFSSKYVTHFTWLQSPKAKFWSERLIVNTLGYIQPSHGKLTTVFFSNICLLLVISSFSELTFQWLHVPFPK